MRSELFHSKNYGGAREGAGRKKIGTSRALRITLPDEEWERIDSLIAAGQASNMSEYFRLLQLQSARFEETK
ncbi:transcriptional regulator [Paenibacillus polymyxa]|uniref:transcriptional regulator n=1 Tax=Paenibacillus polymyxa TaxID=1406 RepID=UPI002AB58B03|nr:transcriptional regulator [Paenibacillus polymyxa]MDY8049656.1 transcriptional regulator [Paenibacillus polymyxa]